MGVEVWTFLGSPPALPAIVNGAVDSGIQDVTSALPLVASHETNMSRKNLKKSHRC